MENSVEPNELEWTDDDIEAVRLTLDVLAKIHDEGGQPRGKERAEFFRELSRAGIKAVLMR